MLPSLKVKIGADTRELDGALNSTQARLRRFARIAAVAAAAVATATAALYSRTAAAIDEQAKLAQSLGTTVRSLQVLERAGELAGVSLGEIEQAASQLTRRLSQAAGGAGPAADALERLNLTATELQSVPLDERINLIQQRLSEFIPQSERAAVAAALFGDRASIAFTRIDQATLQQATADVEDFGVALTEVQADNIEAANDALSRVALIARGLANQMTASLAPAVKAIADGFAAIMREGTAFREFLEGLAGRLAAYGTVIVGAAAAWGTYALAVRAATLATTLFNGALVLTRAALIRTGIGAIVVVLGELVYRAAEAAESVGGIGVAVSAIKDVFLDRFERMKASVQLFGVNFQVMVNEIKFSFTQAMIVMASSFYSFINGVTSAMNQALGTALQTDLGENVIAALTEDLGGLNDSFGELVDRQVELQDRLSEPVLTLSEALETARQEAGDLGTAGGDAGGAIADGMGAATQATEGLGEALTAQQERLKSISETMESSMEDAFMSMVDGTMSAKDAFRAMARDIIAQLYRVLVVQRLVGSFDAQAGTGSGIVGAIMGAFGGARANGGPVSSGKSYLVGERGPELFVPRTSGNVVPNGASVGGQQVVVNYSFQGGITEADLGRALPVFVERTKREVVDAVQRGGSVARVFR